MILQANGSQKKASIATLRQNILQDKKGNEKDGQYIIIKGTIHQEDVTVFNIYVLNMSIKIYKTIISRPKERNLQQYNNSRGL